MRSSVRSWFSAAVVALVAICVAPPMGAHAQICNSTNATTCPASSSSNHVFDTIVVFGSPLDMSDDNVIRLGTDSAGNLQACVQLCDAGCSWHMTPLHDPEHDSGDPIEDMEGNSTFCAGAGADTITVQSSNFDCGGTTLYPMVFNSFSLSILGQQGNDDLGGGYYGTTHLCGGPDVDELSGCFSGGSHDGWTDRDRLYCGGMTSGAFEQWGFSGNDYIYSYAYSAFTNTIEANGEGDDDCILLYNYDTTDLDCGGHSDGDSTNVSPRPATCENTVSSCSWAGN